MENLTLSPGAGDCHDLFCPANELIASGSPPEEGVSLGATGEEIGDDHFNNQLDTFLMGSGLPTGPNQTLPWQEVISILQETNQKSYLGTASKIALITIYVILITFGILGNLVIAFVIGHRPGLRTARNVYIINLTVSDVTLCLVCMPFTLVGLLQKNWSMGNFICKLVPVLQCTNILVSTATIVAIAADRYLTIVCVQRNKDVRAYMPWSVAAIWLMSLVFPLPLFAYYFVEKVQIKDYLLYEKCVESWSSPVVKYSWTIMLIVMQYIIPILVLSFVHGRIQTYLRSHQMSQRDARRAQREIERNRRTTILLTSIAVTFAICWLPWHVVNLLADFHYSGFTDPGYFYLVFGSCHAVAMSSACINPILYGWLNTNLREELLQVLPKIVRKTSCPLRRSLDQPGQTSTVPQRVESVSLLVYKPQQDLWQDGSEELTMGKELAFTSVDQRKAPLARMESTMQEISENIQDDT